MAVHHSWAIAFGLLGIIFFFFFIHTKHLFNIFAHFCQLIFSGNIISFLVGVSPLPTFYQIYKKKSSEGFQSVPYVISLLSATLWMYYALLKVDVLLLITINTFFCVIQTIYISLYLFYASNKARIQTLKLLLLFNVFGFGTICLLTFFLAKGTTRVKIIGYICMAISLSVFVAPLCIVRKVIRTKSVEYMPFTLSFFLTLGAVTWFLYGLLIKDVNIAMVLYMIYRNPKIVQLQEPKLQELSEHIVDVMKLGTMVCSELNSMVPQINAIENDQGIVIEDQVVKKQTDEETKQNLDAPTNV
ncbi:hypothetical protein EZV62_019679 [Acer yangbiense]|uniref:Bidirectional sugar transporter SWEET n=1 Tax=Acer yangbiense TaxID=1000413 RepID=A0A5C7HBE5_9ROSI|nr:hypothetical protein EZV62_019679 [Acer yangbiense]